jgi:hypothetical protein
MKLTQLTLLFLSLLTTTIGTTLINPLPVVIDDNGQLGTGTPAVPVTGFSTGSILLTQQGFPAPDGFTFLGTTKFKYTDLNNHDITITLNVYQKN